MKRPKAIVLSFVSMFLVAMACAQNAPGFDASTVKLTAPGPRMPPVSDPTHLRTSGTLRMLIQTAYGVDALHVKGGPAWADSDVYTVDATTAAPATHEQMMANLRKLLEDRFQLKVTEETAEAPVFNLVVAEGGAKLPPVSDSSPGPVDPDRHQVRVTATSLPNLVRFLNSPSVQRTLGRPVVDLTGLTDACDCTLLVDSDTDTNTGPPVVHWEELPKLLQSQFGLKLVQVQGQVRTLTITQASRPAAQ